MPSYSEPFSPIVYERYAEKRLRGPKNAWEAPPNRGACAGPRARSGRAEPCCPGIGTGVLLAGAEEAEGNEPDDVTGDR